MKLVEKNDYLSIFQTEQSSFQKVLYVLVKITNFLLLDTLAALYFAPVIISFLNIFWMTISTVIGSILLEKVTRYFFNIAQNVASRFGNRQKRSVRRYESGGDEADEYDELTAAQTKRSVLMRGVALAKMKSEIDSLNPLGELKIMLLHKDCYKAEGNLGVSIRPRNSFFEFYGQKDIPYSRVDFAEKCIKKSHESILARIRLSSSEAKSINKQLALIRSDSAQDIYLMKHFLAGFLKGSKQKILKAILFPMSSLPTKSSVILILAIAVLCLYVVCTLGFVVYMGFLFDEIVSICWLVCLVAVIIEDILFIHTFEVLVSSVALPRLAKTDYLAIFTAIALRAKTLQSRDSFSLVRNSSNLIQHFHSACRAARLRPQLPVSRLLMAINDYDLPISHLLEKPSRFGGFFEVFILAFVSLPPFVQSIILQLSAAAITYGFVIALFFAWANSTLLLIIACIVVVVTLLICAACFFISCPPFNRKYAAKRNINFYTLTDTENVVIPDGQKTNIVIDIEPVSHSDMIDSAYEASSIIDSSVEVRVMPLEEPPRKTLNMDDDDVFTVIKIKPDHSSLDSARSMTSGKIKIAAVSDSAADESEFDSYPIPEDQFFDSPLQRAVRKDMELDIKDKLIYNRKKAERRSRNDKTLDAGDEKDPESSREEKQTAAGDESSMGSSSTLTRPSAIDSKRSHEGGSKTSAADEMDEEERKRRTASALRKRLSVRRKTSSSSRTKPAFGVPLSAKQFAERVAKLKKSDDNLSEHSAPSSPGLLPSVNSISNIDISGEEKIDTPKEKAVKEVDMAALEGSSKLDIETDIDIKIPLVEELKISKQGDENERKTVKFSDDLPPRVPLVVVAGPSPSSPASPAFSGNQSISVSSGPRLSDINSTSSSKKDHDSTKSNSSSRLIVKPKDHDAKIQLSSAMKSNPTVNDIPAQSLHVVKLEPIDHSSIRKHTRRKISSLQSRARFQHTAQSEQVNTEEIKNIVVKALTSNLSEEGSASSHDYSSEINHAEERVIIFSPLHDEDNFMHETETEKEIDNSHKC